MDGSDDERINVDKNKFMERWGELMMRLDEKKNEMNNEVERYKNKK